MQWIRDPLQDPLNFQAQHTLEGVQSWNLHMHKHKEIECYLSTQISRKNENGDD